MFGQSRSQGGPGLSINTSSANSLANGQQSQSSTGLFENNQPSKPVESGSFPGPLSGSRQPQQTSSIFGSSSSQGGGLFGSIASKNDQSQPAQSQNGSLFVSNNSLQSQPQQALGGIFAPKGQDHGQNQGQAQQPQSSLFGLSNQNKSSFFPPTSVNQNLSSVRQMQRSFQPSSSIFSTTIGQLSQQQQTIPGVRISINELRSTTRFNDLHDDLQKVIEKVDDFILTQIKYQGECENALREVQRLCEPIPHDVEYCSKTLEAMQNALQSDAESISYAKELVKRDSSNAKLSFNVIQNLKMPQQIHHSGLWSVPSMSQVIGPSLSHETRDGSAGDLVSYFFEKADDMSDTLEGHKNALSQVEAHIGLLETSVVDQIQQMLSNQGRDAKSKTIEDQVRELAAVLKEFEGGILGVASKVGSVREKVHTEILLN